MKKVLILLGTSLLVAVIGATIFGRFLVGYLTPDLIVGHLENSINCRAEVQSVTVSWFGSSKVEIEGVALTHRDDVAGSDTPVAERLPIGSAPIKIAKIIVEVQPFSLLGKQLNVRHLQLDGVDVSLKMKADGSTNIDEMFDALAREGEVAPVVDTKPGETETETTGGFRVEDIPLSIVGDRAEVTNGSLTIEIEKTGSLMQLKDANFGFHGIDVNPSSLAAHNRAEFDFSGRIEFGSIGSETKSFEANVSGRGETRPFDAEAGEWKPAWKSEITLAKGSRLDTVPIMEKARAALEAINEPGIELDNLLVSGELSHDATTEIAYERGRYQFLRSLPLDFGGTLITVHPDSWIDAAEMQHEVRGGITSSEAFTQEVEKKAKAYLAERLGGRVPESLVSLAMQTITREGRIHLELVSSGDVRHPKADIATPVGNLTDLMKGSGKTLDSLKEFGKGFLKGIRGNMEERRQEKSGGDN